MADAADLKSAAREGVRVRIPAPAPPRARSKKPGTLGPIGRPVRVRCTIAHETVAAEDDLVMHLPGGSEAGEGVVEVWSALVDRMSIEADLHLARRRASALMPYSPAWDAAMAIVEDLERALWRRDHPALASPDRRIDETRLSSAHV